jgi:hypothetical protein
VNVAEDWKRMRQSLRADVDCTKSELVSTCIRSRPPLSVASLRWTP